MARTSSRQIKRRKSGRTTNALARSGAVAANAEDPQAVVEAAVSGAKVRERAVRGAIVPVGIAEDQIAEVTGAEIEAVSEGLTDRRKSI